MSFTGFLRQSTTATLSFGPLVAAADGDTEQTGKTLQDTDFWLSKNGGDKANPSDTNDASEDSVGDGVYRKQVNATDTNTLGILSIYIHFTISLYLKQDYAILPANVYDSFFAADRLQVDTREVSGTTQTANDNGADINELLVKSGRHIEV